MLPGTVFELVRLMPFIKKHGKHPTSGKDMSSRDILPLTFAKNADGKYHCPVTFRIFNDSR